MKTNEDQSHLLVFGSRDDEVIFLEILTGNISGS